MGTSPDQPQTPILWLSTDAGRCWRADCRGARNGPAGVTGMPDGQLNAKIKSTIAVDCGVSTGKSGGWEGSQRLALSDRVLMTRH
jgi:hypothetical protein